MFMTSSLVKESWGFSNDHLVWDRSPQSSHNTIILIVQVVFVFLVRSDLFQQTVSATLENSENICHWFQTLSNLQLYPYTWNRKTWKFKCSEFLYLTIRVSDLLEKLKTFSSATRIQLRKLMYSYEKTDVAQKPYPPLISQMQYTTVQ